MKLGETTLLKLAIMLIGLIVVILCIFWLPTLAKNTAEMNPEFAYLKFPILIGIYMTVIPFFIALYQALKLLSYIESENAFSELAVASLKIIKNCGLSIVIIYIIGIAFLAFQNALHPGIAIIGAVIIFAAILISLFTTVLQELLRKALDIKSENELTV